MDLSGEPKPFSWAALASKNTPSGQVSQPSTMPSPPQQKSSGGPGFRQDQGTGPQPQRTQRLGSTEHQYTMYIRIDITVLCVTEKSKHLHCLIYNTHVIQFISIF